MRLDEKTTPATGIMEYVFSVNMDLMGINAKNVPLILLQLLVLTNAHNVLKANMVQTVIYVNITFGEFVMGVQLCNCN